MGRRKTPTHGAIRERPLLSRGALLLELSPALMVRSAGEARASRTMAAGSGIHNSRAGATLWSNPIEHVVFIISEGGDDLIVSFAIAADLAYPGDIESLTLLWTPKYDYLLPPEERGVSVSFERSAHGEDELVVEVRDCANEQAVWVTTARRTYELDVRKVEEDELADMRKVFGEMSRLGGLRYVRL